LELESVEAQLARVAAGPRYVAALGGAVALFVALMMIVAQSALCSVHAAAIVREVAIRLALGVPIRTLRWSLIARLLVSSAWGILVGLILASGLASLATAAVPQLAKPAPLAYVAAAFLAVFILLPVVFRTVGKLVRSNPAALLLRSG
jgi:ABC-type antimicrobial peptide transport system permease subunit